MSEAILVWLIRASLLAGLMGLVVWLAERWCGQRGVGLAPRLGFWLWHLVLLRFVWPSEWSVWRLGGRTSNVEGWLPPSEAAWPAEGLGSPAAEAMAATGEAGWMQILVVLWSVGVVTTALRWLWSRRAFVREALRAVPLTPAQLAERVPGFDVPGWVTVAVGRRTTLPFALGIVRGRIVVPPAVLDGDASRLRAVLDHELAHLRRRDELWLALESLVCALFFFHPMAWWSSRRASLSRELLCDARAVAEGPTDRAAYARVLLATALPTATRRTVAAFSPGQGTIGPRVRAVLTDSQGGGLRGSLALAVVVPLLVVGGPLTASMHSAALVADPLPGARVSSNYGPRIDPFSRKGRHHNGIDLVAPHGTPVRAAGDGIVRRASGPDDARRSTGLMVLIDHGAGVTTTYAHLSAVDVEVGQRVVAGTRIGAVGRTGRVTGTHLHFEIRRANRPHDPARTFENWSRETRR